MRYKNLSAMETAMSESTTSKLHDARDEAQAASRIKAASVVTRLQQSGNHWTLTAKPEKSK